MQVLVLVLSTPSLVINLPGVDYSIKNTTRKTGIWEGGKPCQILEKSCQMLFGTALARFWLCPKYEGAKYIWVGLKRC